MEEHISTGDPSDFQKIQSNLQDIFSMDPSDFYFHALLDTLITPRIFCLIFKVPFRFSRLYPFFTHLHAPRISSSVWGVRIENRTTFTQDSPCITTEKTLFYKNQNNEILWIKEKVE